MDKGAVVVDLFCGVGGMTHGFIKENFRVAAGVDNDLTCKYAYEKNNSSEFIYKSIEEFTGDKLSEIYANSPIRILIGCAPCQPFSNYNHKKFKDDKWKLLYEFARLIKEVEPEIVSMENVPQIAKYSVFNNFIDTLEKRGYNVFWKIVYCPAYGIPQNRKRLVLLASKLGKISLLDETHSPKKYLTVKDVLGKLPTINAGESDKKDPLHTSRNLSPINYKRIINTSTGGGWKEWNKNLVLACHKKKNGKSFKGVYGRMSWDQPSPTITTEFYSYGSGRFGHPSQNRAISYREGALLQTFPKYYDLIDPTRDFSGAMIGRHIGNAVPVKLGRIIAKSIKNHINSFNK